MASLINGKNGRRIDYMDADGKRRTIYPGKISKRQAEVVKLRVEDLLTAKLSGDGIKAETTLWLNSIEDRLHDKLVYHELTGPRTLACAVTLGDHLENYVAARTDVKAGTLLNWGHTKRCLRDFFGAERQLTSITSGDARDFERWLRTPAARKNRYADSEAETGLAPNTARKRVSNAKQFFEDALERELISKNPFADLKGAVGSNRKRDFFITRDMATKVLGACPDLQWRLLFSLARYGGMRCPSEVLALEWNDIDWAEHRMLVRSSKTEHHEGKATRIMPIFPELRIYLEEAWDTVGTRERYVINRYRDVNANLRTQLNRIIKRAGLNPWPKLFQNLRSTRETELAETYPIHVVCDWIGNSPKVAADHYLQTTDAHFERATQEVASKAPQKAPQHSLAEGETASQEATDAEQKGLVVQGCASHRDLVHKCLVGVPGFEPGTSALSA